MHACPHAIPNELAGETGTFVFLPLSGIGMDNKSGQESLKSLNFFES